MTSVLLAGIDVELNEEGFLVDPNAWTEEMAPELARKEGIEPLTELHWQVIRFMRSEYFAKGTGPTVRMLGKTSGVSIKELYQLFPKVPPRLPHDRRHSQAQGLYLILRERGARS